jgi:hypothetical protein
MRGAFQPWGGIGLTGTGGLCELQHPCLAVRHAPWRFWLSQLKPHRRAHSIVHSPAGESAKAALCTISWVASVRLAVELKGTRA